jgi:catechol 2,3-dioxygenase-like lactoylglutathione lyase family enzyme
MHKATPCLSRTDPVRWSPPKGTVECRHHRWFAALPVSASGGPRLGEIALVFYVSDMEEALTKLRALGATWAPPPVLFKLGHISQLETCLRDPDGVLINLIEADPSQQNRTTPDVVLAPLT